MVMRTGSPPEGREERDVVDDWAVVDGGAVVASVVGDEATVDPAVEVLEEAPADTLSVVVTSGPEHWTAASEATTSSPARVAGRKARRAHSR
jgi:hypothetical protein